MGFSCFISDTAGARIYRLDKVDALNCTLVTNGISAFSVAVPIKAKPYVKKDHIVEIWYRGKFLCGGFIRTWSISDYSIALSCPSFEYLLSGRIIAYAAGTSEADKTDYADDMIKAIVRENLGSSATASRQLSITVQADTSAGETISRAFSHYKVLDTIQNLALESAENGTRLYFGFRPYFESDNIALVFETTTNQWGTNHDAESNSPLTFSKQFGNLENYVEEFDYWDEINDVYVGGQGLGEDRIVEQVTDTIAATNTPWARRERFLSYTSELTTTGLQNAGKAVLYASRGKETFSANLLDTPLTQFNLDWQWGDKVAILQNGRDLVGIVEKIRLRSQEDRETLTAKVEGNL